MQEAIIEIIQMIQPIDTLEAEHIGQTLTWIHSGAPLFRTQKPATPPQHLVAYFVVVDLSQHQLLLADHKDAGLWLPSGGHVELGEHPRETVLREAQEELTIAADLVWPHPLFLTVTQTQGVSTKHIDVSLWYVLHGDVSANLIYDQGEFYGVRWFAFDQLPLTRTDPHLARFVAKLQQLL